MFNADSTIESRYVDPVDPNAKPLPGVPACLLITADKGLAGAYNQNAIRQAQQLLTAHGDAALYVVGEYGRRWFTQRGIPIEKSFLSTPRRTPPCAVPVRSASCCWSGTTPVPSTLSTSSTRT